MAVRQVGLALLVCLAVGACDAGGEVRAGKPASKSASASAASCADGVIRWAGSSRDTELIAVSRVMDVSKAAGRVKHPLVPVRTFEPRVDVSDSSVPARRVFTSFARRNDRERSFVMRTSESLLSERGVNEGLQVDSVGTSGRFVEAEGIRVLRATFTVDCPGADADSAPVYGSVTAYGGSFSASLQCGVDPAEEGGKEAWIQEAYELTCGRG